MAEPARLMGHSASNNDSEDNDIDGEYEVDEDVDFDQISGMKGVEGNTTDAEGSDVDAEGEEVDDDDDEPVGAVKLAVPEDSASEDNEDNLEDGDAAVESFSDAKSSVSDDSASNSSESENENEWQGENEEDEERESGRVDSSECIFCGEDEDHDPSPDFEEYLTCISCRDNAHPQCARDANTLSSDDDPKKWRCTACLQDAQHQDDAASVSESITRRRLSSVPKVARDLLPSHRGADPGGHSVFNELILSDDPMDGSRSLRKRRKSSLDQESAIVRQMRKKRRSSELSKSEVESTRLTTKDAVSDAGTDADDAQDPTGEHESSRLRSARARRGSRSRNKRNDKRPLVWIEDDARFGPLSLVVVFHLNNEKVQKIVTAKPKKKGLDPRLEVRREKDRERRERNRRAALQTRAESPEVSHYPAIQPNYGALFYGFADKEVDESKSKPYGGILSEADADTSKTYPAQIDRKKFEDARLKAEDDWKKKQAALYGSQEVIKSNKHPAPASKIKCVNFGGWEIDTWHAAPYPEEYSKNKVLYICEFCLKYMNSDYVAWRHKLKCPAKHPPGDEIYRDGKYSFFEVDGRKNPVYCQNLCLLAKLFLGSKTLYYDVEPFLFYVMTENDQFGCHFVGYFSKEKRPSSLNNVSCILVLPIHMRKGYGQYLIEFSYLLTRVERKTGSPEKPLSDMGLVSYRKYWRLVLCEELLDRKAPLSISTISERTGMTPDDIVSALEGLRALVRDPVTKTYALRVDRNYLKQYIEKCNASNSPKINPESLVWTPYVMGRLGQYEDGPALHTVQPREELEDEEDKPAPEEGVQMDLSTKENGVSQDDAGSVPTDAEPNTPALPADDSRNGSPGPGTPLAMSTVALAGSQPSTTQPPIPPSRFEVFPPIPGMPAAKRRPGRPFGSRRRTTSTPQRIRGTPLSIATAPVSKIQLPSPSRNGNGKQSPSANGSFTPSLNIRRTRSRLGESVVNGIDTEDAEDGGAVRAVNGRSTRSSTGSPHHTKIQKGKDKAPELDGPGSDVDAEGEDEDIDAEGEMDIDAEGEYDDEMDLVMANA
ncbi:hypothetical protein BU24DRAFT_382704 [Aaosphaeria arxii CBS 175.79]|uniref:Histone acetyltransferase n=1 Tax=Aaosphaeria arxii CBS 175.79 TaxID=1450172 RepID=A0A6A5Y5A4_9PLEO|nr:uncharacterized protein BU24DRAFT_382704 [Aaosphaeria arxii CBS 175.79]KAF2020742.1 hypothetical protein BU24DRAFT_382704 [Aaosphaeria arxii CBS 175.79]